MEDPPDNYIDHDEYYEDRDGGPKSFYPNTFYYHMEYPIKSIRFQTDKAYLLQHKEGLFWVPKALCKMSICRKSMYIHKSFRPKFLKEK